jgi:2,5-diketo-D-gluconate reductase B
MNAEQVKIGFGTYRLHDDTYESVISAIQSGYEAIDNAPLYKNQELVGQAVKDCGRNRKNLFITTKISRNQLKTHSIVESIESSLDLMGLDYIDELILHEPIHPLENWQILSEYFNTSGKGKIGKIGVSNFNQKHLKMIYEDEKSDNPSVNQIEVNPFLARTDLVNYCNDIGLQIVAHSPLAKAEKLDDEQLIEIAEKHCISPSQVMLRWGFEKGFRVIPRSKDLSHIQENLNLDFCMDEGDMAILDSLDCGYTTHPKYLKA